MDWGHKFLACDLDGWYNKYLCEYRIRASCRMNTGASYQGKAAAA